MTDGDFDLLTEVASLIDAWCDRRELRALSRLLPAWLASNGLTDGWADVLHALRTVRADVELPDDEASTIESAIIAVDRVVYRT